MHLIDSVRLSFIIVSLFLILVLVLLSVYMYKKENKYKNCIIRPIIIGIFSIIFYCLFLISESHKYAVFFDSLFFIGTDWLAMFMLFFAIGYTEIAIKYEHKLLVLFSVLCGLDSISLFVNNFTFHMFDLVQMVTSYGLKFWGNDFGFLHYVHLALCYVMVAMTFLYFGLSLFKAPGLCKTKYLGILIAYIIVIAANFICYSLNLVIDISVILYGALAGFICYFSTFTYPNKMLANMLRSINDTVSDAIVYFNTDGSCIYANRPAGELFENDHTFEPYLAEAYRENLEKSLKKNQNSLTIEDKFKINGRERHYTVEYRKDFFIEKNIGSYIKLMDITEDYVNYRKERYAATHDSFTGILNRNGFFEAVDKTIEEKGTFGYVMLTSNIRDFKVVNELFGEDLGDDIIYKQAGILKTFSHPGTVYGRICDDKFAVYTKKEYFIESEFKAYMDLMQKVLETPSYSLKILVGVYYPQGMVETAQSMYDKALLATTRITNNYSQIFAYYDNNLMEKLLYEKTINMDFESAIENKEIQMMLHPIVNMNREWIGAEAISCWKHPNFGKLMPEKFIYILEKSGLIYKIDAYIWEEAAKVIKHWTEIGIKNFFISVNVSVKDFFYTDIYKTFTRLIERYDIVPESLHIEITEFVLMSDFAKVLSVVNKLQKAGFSVIIDNFGNDYSSLNMLKDFTSQGVKIGKELIKSTQDSERNKIILGSIINMSHALDIEVISDGIESEEQFKMMRDYNCKYFQGDYLSEPKLVQDFEEIISH